jgi:hypothetical protein
MRFAVLADDLTGACDSAAPFRAAGRVVVSMWPHVYDGDAACYALSTESRDCDAATSRDRSRRAAQMLRSKQVDILYRKVDSQMRGNVAADIAGALEGWGGRCIFAPALPEEGRVTIGGHQRWAEGDVDLRALLAFHSEHGGAATITVVRPANPWGVAELGEDGEVTGFREKPQLDSWVNGGFMVMEPRALDRIGPDDVLERRPLERLAAERELFAFRHEGFWDCMDTYKDHLLLNELWARGEAPWSALVTT